MNNLKTFLQTILQNVLILVCSIVHNDRRERADTDTDVGKTTWKRRIGPWPLNDGYCFDGRCIITQVTSAIITTTSRPVAFRNHWSRYMVYAVRYTATGLPYVRCLVIGALHNDHYTEITAGISDPVIGMVIIVYYVLWGMIFFYCYEMWNSYFKLYW